LYFTFIYKWQTVISFMYLYVEVASKNSLNIHTGKEYQFLNIFLIKLVNSKVFYLI
jgi:hypothetical protein